jgi:hypothetical protein
MCRAPWVDFIISIVSYRQMTNGVIHRRHYSRWQLAWVVERVGAVLAQIGDYYACYGSLQSYPYEENLRVNTVFCALNLESK